MPDIDRFLTELPWPWYAAGLALIAALMYLADAYEQGLLPRARATLDTSPVLVGADLDATVPPCQCDECQADDLVTEIEAWLSARARFEEQL